MSISKFSDLWKSLIVINLLISLFMIWILYSQNSYFLEIIKEGKPIVVASNTPQTAVVISPFTGTFILLGSFTIFSILFIIIAILFVFLYKNR